MIRKAYKPIVLISAFLFILPIATSFCCCVEIGNQTHHLREPAKHHHEHAQEHGHDHGKTGSSHDHNECNHPKILAALAKQTIDLFSPAHSFLYRELKLRYVSTLLVKNHFDSSSWPPLETGPPGPYLSSAPLYLQISVLRI